MRETAAQKEVWLLSLFYFFYLGMGITLGGMAYGSYLQNTSLCFRIATNFA